MCAHVCGGLCVEGVWRSLWCLYVACLRRCVCRACNLGLCLVSCVCVCVVCARRVRVCDNGVRRAFIDYASCVCLVYVVSASCSCARLHVVCVCVVSVLRVCVLCVVCVFQVSDGSSVMCRGCV